MSMRPFPFVLLACAFCLLAAGCNAPGKPTQQVESRPEELADFSSLYKQNCAACHGERGQGGAAISLANPVYLETAGVENIKRITAAGVRGTSMPPFAQSSGGMLTDRQISILAEGVVNTWGHASSGTSLPYSSSLTRDVTKGHDAYTTFCARCHGADGTGVKATHIGSIVDPAYLSLISDQGLRSIVIAGRPDEGMPDWRSDAVGANPRAMSDQEVTDVVAWLASHRIAAPGQPYGQQP